MLREVPSLEQWWQFFGSFHPILVHFPIGLLVAACLLEFLRRRRGERTPSSAATACLLLGTLGAAAAALAGWSSAERAGYAGTTLDWHRWAGVSAAVVSAATLIACGIAWWRPGRQALVWHRFMMVALVVAVGAAGHLGGTLVHGDWFGAALARLRSPASDSGLARAAAPTRSPGREVSAPPELHAVLALFGTRCTSCHSGAEPAGGLALGSRDALLRGGDSGVPAIVPGKSQESLLLRLVRGDDPARVMPPKGAPLSAEAMATLAAWIDAGAPWEEATDGPHWHWAYRAPVRPNLPAAERTEWPRTPIDHFVLAAIEQAGLSPSAEADRATLLRRVTLDLTGLPPTPEAIDAFLADDRADAYDRVVTALLDSPAYGERMARPWLDLARYADTHGYEKDNRRQIWAYRDWVIDALNRDLPYDRFTVEQLAGDLLPAPTIAQRIATGFNRNTMINEEGGTDQEEFRVEALFDRVATLGAVWLGTTLSCAQCHDHKNDPISHEEYFRLFAFFNDDIEEVRRLSSIEATAEGGMLEIPALADWARYDALASELEAAQAERARLEANPLADASALDAARGVVERLESARRGLVAGTTLVMQRAPEPRVTRVMNKGSFLDPGAVVTPDVPAILPPMSAPPEARDRLALARWLVDPANPLVARVAVNRMWELHFGRGIVETSEDFGVQGDAPSHPELLDWLATEFVRQGWSMKQIHRLIVTSATYRQSSQVTAEHLERDPRNVLLARFPRQRLEAEMLRDAALSIGGLLSPKLGGPSVFPPQPEGVWTMIYSADRWTESAGEDRFRRGIYTFWRRTAPHPSLTSFDAPSREIACTRRPRTSSPLQALITLNDPQFVEAAAGLARRALAEGEPDDEARIVAAFRLCTARPPTPNERARLLAFLRAEIAAFAAAPENAAALLDSLEALRGIGIPRSSDAAAALPGSSGPTAPEWAAWIVLANLLLNLDETQHRG
ncbi:MAG TPA: PSD1 and planctomycete cytochrome C domain-containing protein [Phycisphaerales bacterium]|nr:PSD1 and planctomycete cytochrome C domain-containing protein [Phycisphaerales bacterium]HMP35895.1 PSD1 and planctomycete cytochrome C domain-containing protein [Phycisphaerales bacterium]